MKGNRKYLVLIILLIVLFGGLGYYGLKTNHYSLNSSNEIDLKMDEMTMQSYLDKLPFNNERIDLYKDAYYGEKVLFSDVSDTILDMFVNKYKPKNQYLMSFKNSKYDEDYYNYSDEEVQELIDEKKLENATIHLLTNVNDFLESNYNSNYYSLKSNNDIELLFSSYKKSKYIVFIQKNEKSASSSEIITLERKVKQDGEDIVIYEKALIAVKDDNSYKIYKNSNLSNSNSYIKTISGNFVETVQKQLKKKNYTEFKHTFKKNNGNYYWYSSEVVNN